MYGKIVDFVRDESARQSASGVGDLGGQVPPQVLTALDAERQKRNNDRFKVTKQDALCKQVYDIEREWTKQQVARIIELIGELPRYSIGTQIREKDHAVSIDKLIDDILKLPNMSLADEGREAADSDSKLLNEYTNLRHELMRKCSAIRLAELRVQEREHQARMIRSLFTAIEESTTTDSATYFESYREKVFEQLQDSRYLLEDAIKSDGTNPGKRAKIQQILD